MGRSVPFRTSQNGRAWTLALIGAIGLAAVFAALDRARVCEGPGCVSDAIGQAVALKGGGDRLTGYATGRSAHGVGAAVESGVRATGRAVGEVADNTGKAATGQP